MEDESRKKEVADALAVLHRYLSDAIAPLQAADGLRTLLDIPRAAVAEEIGAWASEMFRGRGSDFQYSELLLLGLKRLYSFNDYQLLPRERVSEFLRELCAPLLLRCPENERQQFSQGLSVIDSSVTDFNSSSLIRPSAGFGRVGQTGGRTAADDVPGARGRGMSLVLDRVVRNRSAQVQPAAAVAPQIFTTAALAANSGAELEQACSILQGIGLPITPPALFRMMGDSLPGWSLQPQTPRATDAAAPQPPSAMLEAMGRIIQFAGSGRESASRWEDLVKSAVEQLNQGSPSRAAAMLGLAENVLKENPQDPHTVANLRSVGHQFVDVERLRTAVENAQNHPHLRRVMGFFDELRPESLLRQLETETKRNRRRLILDLLEVHGEAVRNEAFALLAILVEGGIRGQNWHFPRNLVYLLHRIRPASGLPPDVEFDMIAGFLDPSRPASLVKEAVTYLGQYRHPKSEECLEALLLKLEDHLLNSDDGPSAQAPNWSILDRVAFALARLGTARSVRALRVHGLQSDPILGNTSARLVHLASQDVGVDPESVEAIIQAARKALPRKLLGVRLRKESREITNLIAALSATPSPEVHALMQEISGRFPDEEYGQAAQRCLKELEVASRKSEDGGSKLMGDLDLFGLPGLLAQLERSRATGALSLKEKSGNVVGEIDLHEGRLIRATSGRLTGDAALYRLIEKPAAASFVFQRRRIPLEAGAQEPAELAPLIEDGMRRYDEFEWLRVVVPDGAVLKQAGDRPAPDSADADEELCDTLWRSVISGSTAAECENLIPQEPLRIRRIISRWLEAGLLSEV